MDLSSSMNNRDSIMMSQGSTNINAGTGGGAVACPVCTLYLREGISLQKHLDTHPKEQVIEALIRASSSGSGISSLFGQISNQTQIQSHSQNQPQSQLPIPSLNSANNTVPTTVPSSHVPHVPAQSPYPIGPIFECPPINAMMPPQFASFSYQQFVNNGTMMIPAQYAMASAQPPQTNQMMQMLYNPYGMYHQQQIPTVQMISPLTSPIPASTTSSVPTIVSTARSTATITPIIETSTVSRPQPTSITIAESQKQIMTNEPPVPDSILPEIESPPTPEPENTTEIEDNNLQIQQENVQNSQENLDAADIQRNLSSNNMHIESIEEDNSERILPEIEDTGEIPPDIPCMSRTEINNEIINNDSPRKLNITIEMKNKKRELPAIQNKESSTEQINNQPKDLSINKSNDQLESLLINIIETEFNNVEISNKKYTEKLPDKLDKNSESNLHKEIIIEEGEELEEDKRISDNEDEDDYDEETELEKRAEKEIDQIDENYEQSSNLSHKVTKNLEKSNTDSQAGYEFEFFECNKPYCYRYSRSAPVSPLTVKNHSRSFSRMSLNSNYGLGESMCIYPVGFEATTLQDYLQDNYDNEDMEIEDLSEEDNSKNSNTDSENSDTSVDDNIDIPIKKRRKKLSKRKNRQPIVQIKQQVEDKTGEDRAADSFKVLSSVIVQAEQIHLTESSSKYVHEIKHQVNEKTASENETTVGQANLQLVPDYVNQFSVVSNTHHSQSSTMHETFPVNNNSQNSENFLNISECNDASTSVETKIFTSSKLPVQKPSTELLNINEDAHTGPMNVFEFDGLQLLVPSTFITESSQKAVSVASHHSLSNSENGMCNDEEVRSVNMRADESMPPRGELSEQESNGCTEQSAWQLYMGQESSRMSTSYDLMARESWGESEGSDNEVTGPLLDSRSLATHFTSSLFLDRDRKTPTRRIFKCFHCPEVFECPKERRVHSTMIHKEPGPSSSRDGQIDPLDLKELKMLESRTNVFEDIFAQGLHVQQAYHHQQPLLHQLQPPQHINSIKETDRKLDSLNLPTVSDVSCHLCNQRFTSEKSLQLHCRRVHIIEATRRIRENAKCQICNEEFSSVTAFNLHLKIHPLECGQCGKYFYRKQNFKLHMKRHLGIKPFPCTICDKAFLTKQKLDEHMNGHTGNAPVKCNLCNETFRRYSNLTQHKNRHHLNIKKKLKDYICHCGEVFHTKKKLAWHKETHEEKPKSCTYCNERFIHMASLTRHMRRAHNRRFVPDAQRDNENVECPICKCIYLRSSLAVHMRVHNGERPYECQVCSKAFSTKWNLQLHKWTHAARSTKPFKCNQCSAAFYRHSDYTAHMNSHRNVRPYTCNYCGAQFIRKYNCLRHVKEHEENKQYTCDVCNKTFHRSYYLKEHLRVHSGARPYTCHICGKSSSTKSNHNKHVRIHHAREPVNTEN